MISSVISPATRVEDWPEIRGRIYERIIGSMGMPPAEGAKPQWQELKRWQAHGLTHVLIKYHVLEDVWNEGILVLPEGDEPAAVVVTIHGCIAEGKTSNVDPDNRPRRAYGTELAQTGLATFSVDQFGFGASVEGSSLDAEVEKFYARWPDWSLDGRRLLEQQRAIDTLAAMDCVKAGEGVGVMGNSLGGRAAVHLACLEERVKAAVPSTGLSPVLTNGYRLTGRDRLLCPALSKHLDWGGERLWEYNEMLALCAPRALLLLEPFNDSYNPSPAATFGCFDAARQVYQLLGSPGNISMLVHGDGHDTIYPVRQYAYAWLRRFLTGDGESMPA
jgi:pimeloyl-ACP methyl ester carboxylesterase